MEWRRASSVFILSWVYTKWISLEFVFSYGSCRDQTCNCRGYSSTALLEYWKPTTCFVSSQQLMVTVWDDQWKVVAVYLNQIGSNRVWRAWKEVNQSKPSALFDAKRQISCTQNWPDLLVWKSLLRWSIIFPSIQGLHYISKKPSRGYHCSELCRTPTALGLLQSAKLPLRYGSQKKYRRRLKIDQAAWTQCRS